MPHERVQVHFQGHKLARISKKALYQEIYGAITKKKWKELHDIPEDLLHDGIHWEALRRAMEREPLGKQRWLCKHCARQCGVGRNLKRRKYQSHDNCPRCDQPNETTTHVLRCLDVGARNQWADTREDLITWLQMMQTNMALQDAILQRLTFWHSADDPPPIEGPRALREAIKLQDRLGWENFLMGRISPALGAYQQVHYTNIGSRRTGDSWTSQLINQVWLIMWRMWEHRNQVNSSGLTAQDLRERAGLL